MNTAHKYDTDGHLRFPKAEEVVVGTVIRMPYLSDGAVPAFSDSVVIGIHYTDKKGNKSTYPNIAEAMQVAKAERGDSYHVVIELARPYLYASSIGICFNWLTGVERYATDPYRLLSLYKVIEESDGKLTNYNHSRFTATGCIGQ